MVKYAVLWEVQILLYQPFIFIYLFIMEIFFFIEKLKTWVHQIKPISGGKKSKLTIEKKKLTLSGPYQNPENIFF